MRLSIDPVKIGIILFGAVILVAAWLLMPILFGSGRTYQAVVLDSGGRYEYLDGVFIDHDPHPERILSGFKLDLVYQGDQEGSGAENAARLVCNHFSRLDEFRASVSIKDENDETLSEHLEYFEFVEVMFHMGSEGFLRNPDLRSFMFAMDEDVCFLIDEIPTLPSGDIVYQKYMIDRQPYFLMRYEIDRDEEYSNAEAYFYWDGEKTDQENGFPYEAACIAVLDNQPFRERELVHFGEGLSRMKITLRRETSFGIFTGYYQEGTSFYIINNRCSTEPPPTKNK